MDLKREPEEYKTTLQMEYKESGEEKNTSSIDQEKQKNTKTVI